MHTWNPSAGTQRQTDPWCSLAHELLRSVRYTAVRDPTLGTEGNTGQFTDNQNAPRCLTLDMQGAMSQNKIVVTRCLGEPKRKEFCKVSTILTSWCHLCMSFV